MEALSLNTVQILNRQKSSLTKKPWSTRLPKTVMSWRNNVNLHSNSSQDPLGSSGYDRQIKIPVNRRLFGCTQCMLVPCPQMIAEPQSERIRLERSYVGVTLRYVGRLIPIDCNVYQSVSTNEIFLFYESILFVVSPSLKRFKSRGLQKRLGILEYYDFLGVMDGKNGRDLPRGQLKLPDLSFAASFSEDTRLELKRSLDLVTKL